MTTLAKPMKDSYFDLVRRHPLLPIKSEAQLDAALAFLGPLAVRGEKALDSGERAYLAALTQFVEDYEREHHAIEAADLGPLEALKFLMQANDMKAIDLGKLLGSRGLASQILNGKRELSKKHILVLARRFNVEPGLFLAAE
ncbi:MAG: helix-turn-helix domain-containing protein [Planctomycetota bacterium]|nr:helix-turn-helix domain-containing protein [Planctomycetota bacterium]